MKYYIPFILVVGLLLAAVASAATTKGTASATVCKEIAPRVYDCGGKVIRK